MSDVRTVKLKFSDLVFLEDNPRTITREKLERLAERIKKDPTFFENRPCLVNFTDGKYICYAGFQRSHAAAKILKWKEVPCSVENDVPAELMRERAILDNTHDGEWNAHVLANWEFEVPELIDLGVPEFVFGEGSNAINSEKLEAQEDEYEIPDEIKTDIVPGDLFEIGRHRLLCGDSTNADDVAKLMDGEKADFICADPPYGISYKSPSGKGKTERGDYAVLENDDKPFDPNCLFGFCEKIVTWGANHYADKLPASAAWLIWDKREGDAINNNSDCELAWCSFGGSARLFHHKWNGMIKASEKNEKRVHPTQKPVKLIEWIFKICEAGINILDPFLGSGTTMVAAHQLNRRCYGMEIDPKYCQVIVDRMLKLDPTLEIKRNGQPYQKTGN